MPTSVQLFGAPTIVRDGESPRIDTRKAVAILAYLAVEGPAVRRDRLASLLWPESSQDRARAVLRRTLTSLRRAVGRDAIAATRETVALVPTAVTVDCIEFAEAMAAGDLATSAAIYRGEFLAGFSLRDAPDFDDWHRLESDRFRHEADRALEGLAANAAERGHLAEAFATAQRRIKLDPLNEDAYRTAMLLAAKQGKGSEAVALYRTCLRTLEEELAVEPLPATVAVYEAIRRGEVPAEPQPRPSEPPLDAAALAEPALVGRDGELARLDAALITPGGRAIAVAGGPGTGKTRLLETWRGELEARGRRVVLIRCFDGEQGLPFAPLLTLVRRLASGDDPLASELIQLLAGPDTDSSHRDGPGRRLAAFEALLALFAREGLRGGVLIVDDAHLADPSSREFFTYVARRVDLLDLVVVLSTAPGLAMGLRDVAHETLWLAPLSAGEIRRLADLLAVTDEKIVAETVETTGGIPALVLASLQRRAPDRPAAVATPTLDALPEAVRQVMEAAATVDRPADIALLQHVAGRSLAEIAGAVETLVQNRLVRFTAGGTVEPAAAHVVAEVLTGINPARRRLLHDRAAERLQRTPGKEAEAARHHHLAGNDAEAARLYASAAERAAMSSANAEAARHLGRALALGHPDPARLHTLLGDVESFEGRYAGARAAYEKAAALTAGNELAQIEHRLGLLALRRGDLAAAESHLRSGLLELDDGPAVRSRILAALAVVSERTGNTEEAGCLGAEAVATASESGDVTTEAQAHNVAGLAALARGDHASAARELRDALRLGELAGSPDATAAAHNGLGLLAMARDDPATALGHFEAAVTIVERIADRHHLAVALSNLGDAQQALGKREAAQDAIRRSATLLADIGGHPAEGRAGVWSLTSW